MTDRSLRAPRWLVLGAIGLIAIGCLLRFSGLGQFAPWYDEVVTLKHLAVQSDADLAQAWAGREWVLADLWQSLATEPRKTAFDTIRSLAGGNAHHPPLYYLVVRAWADWFGNTIVSLRLVTALIGVALLPCTFWLLRQVSDRPSLPWIGTALVALSPLQILYAQEAREYALWLVFFVLSSGLLAQALGRSSWQRWTLYGLALTATWYSHLLGGLVVVGHGLWVVQGVRRSPDRSWRRVVPWAIAAIGTFLAISPWLWMLYQARVTASGALQWLSSSPLPGIQRWAALRAMAAMVWDNQPSIWKSFPAPTDSGRLVIVGLAVVAVVRCWRSSEPRLKAFVLTTIAPFLLMLWLPAFLADRSMAAIVRYELPMILALQVALADWIAALCDRLQPKPALDWPQPLSFYLFRWRWMPQVFAGGLAIVLVFSTLTAAKARSWQPTWWTKGGSNQINIAKALKKVDQPLILSSPVPGEYPNILALSYAFDRLKIRNTQFLLILNPLQTVLPDRPNTFVINPSPELKQAIEQRSGKRLIPTGKDWWQLWRIEPAGPGQR